MHSKREMYALAEVIMTSDANYKHLGDIIIMTLYGKINFIVRLGELGGLTLTATSSG